MSSNFIHVSLSHLPSSLKKNNLFKKICENYREDKKTIPFPQDFYEKEISILSLVDMIETIDYLSPYSSDISFMNFDFIIENRDLILQRLPELKKKLPCSSFLKQIIILLTTDGDKLLNLIVEYNYLSLLKYCIQTEILIINFETICSLVAKYGNLEMLQYVHNLGGILNSSALDFTIQNKDNDCYTYILQNIEDDSKDIEDIEDIE